MRFFMILIIICFLQACEEYIPPDKLPATGSVTTSSAPKTHAQAVAAALGEQIWNGFYKQNTINGAHCTIIMHAKEGTYVHVAPWNQALKQGFYYYFTVVPHPGWEVSGFTGSIFTQQGADYTVYSDSDTNIQIVERQLAGG